jgi:DNA-binding transcriptional MerR regulator
MLEMYSAVLAAEVCGFKTVAMLDYLQRSGVFVPRHRKEKRRGKGRRYDFRDLIVLRTLNNLLESGASVQMLKKALVEFQKHRWTADPVTLEDSEGMIRYFIVSAGSVYMARDAMKIVDLSKGGQLVFSFIVDLEAIRLDLRKRLNLPDPQVDMGF